MTAPIRLRLSRVKGFNLQAASMSANGLPAVKVARPSRWGNRWKIGETAQIIGGRGICKTIEIKDAATAVWLFRQEYEGHMANPAARKIVCEAIKELRGKNLACFCALDAPCHADVLLELANAKEER